MSPSTVYSNQYLSFLQCQMAKRLLIQYACGPTYSGLGPWDWFDSIPQLISICWDDRRQALLLKRFNWHLAASETTRDDSDAQKFFHRKVCKLHDFSKDFFYLSSNHAFFLLFREGNLGLKSPCPSGLLSGPLVSSYPLFRRPMDTCKHNSEHADLPTCVSLHAPPVQLSEHETH